MSENSSDVRFLVTNRAGFPRLLGYCNIVFGAREEKIKPVRAYYSSAFEGELFSVIKYL